LIFFLEEIDRNENTTPNEQFVSTFAVVQHSQLFFNELVVDKEIGEGGYGKVFLGKWNGASVALKFCKKQKNVEDFMRELKLMMYVSI
jgi:predicted Ser/Thr protein kinase